MRIPPLYHLFYDKNGKLKDEIGNAALVLGVGFILFALIWAIFR